MTAGVPYIVSNDASSSGASFTTTVVTKPGAGDTLVVFIGTVQPAVITSVTDPRGNTYTVVNTSSTIRPAGFAYCVNPAGQLQLGDLITVNLTSSQAGRAVTAGIPAIGSVDLTPPGNGTDPGSSPSAATGTLNAPNETCLAVICNSGGQQPSSLNWTLLTYESSFPVLTTAYTLPGATTASQTFTATISGGAAYDTGVMTLAPSVTGGDVKRHHRAGHGR